MVGGFGGIDVVVSVYEVAVHGRQSSIGWSWKAGVWELEKILDRGNVS